MKTVLYIISVFCIEPFLGNQQICASDKVSVIMGLTEEFGLEVMP
jgi:hypothetical protein